MLILRAYLLTLVIFLPVYVTAGVVDCEILLGSNSRAEKVSKLIFQDAGLRDNQITVHDSRFYGRFLADPELNLGETYMDGLWDSPAIDDLTAQLLKAQVENGRFAPLKHMWRTPGLTAIALLKNGYRYFRDGLTNRQTRPRSATVAKEHYDAGNQLYRRMLDPTMTYTSGLWAEGFTLEDSQNAKYDLIARKLDLKPGQHVLDIGSGFGGFARFAAKNYGARVTGITISIEQLKAARALSEGFPRVNFVFSDYRDIANRFPKDTFDHVVSIEMIEAVGVKNLEEYFHSAHSALKDGGRFVVQHIASHDDVVNSNPWFSTYIFKDGVAPSANQIDRAAKASFGPALDRQSITADYDKTLMAWHLNFTAAWPDLKNEYSARFKRRWDFYLLSVAGAFRVDQTHVYQSVFVKNNTQKISPVRTLPSLRRLQALRATTAEIERTALLIGALEDEKKSSPIAGQSRSPAPIPLRKDARIAVLGAGPSGLSAADELRRLGYANVVVFEKENTAGGKSHTVDIEGRPHDLGATMGVKQKYAEIEKYASLAGQSTIPFPKEVNYELIKGAAEQPATLSDNLKFALQGLLYIIRYKKIGGSSERFERPSEELADPWMVVMKRHGMETFGDRMKTYLTGYGYGGPETPAVFGMRMLDPGAILGAAVSNSIMWQNGTQPIWKALASRLDVRTGSEITRIVRAHDGIEVYVNGQTRPERFDKLIVAVDPHIAARIVDVTKEESDLFSMVRHTPYATFAVRVEGFSEGRAEVGYLRENMTLDLEGRPMAWIKRYADDNVFVFHLFAPQSISDAQIMQNIDADMRRLGATNTTLVDSRRWPFFPHVDAKAMREDRFFERIWNIQGQRNTVYINEALGMSTMPDSVAQAKSMALQLAEGL